jgi:hypothetical protein
MVSNKPKAKVQVFIAIHTPALAYSASKLQHKPIPNLRAGTRPHTRGTDPTRPRLLFRTRPTKIAFDAGLTSAPGLIGTDIAGGPIQLGYELFRDEHSLRARFVIGSIFDEDFLARSMVFWVQC